MRRVAVLISILLSVALVHVPGWSGEKEAYPVRPIKVIVPFSAGGSVDIMARNLAKHWEKELKQPVVIENKGGASGMLGVSEFLKARPDGYHLLIGIQPALSNNIIIQQAPFKLEDIEVLNVEQLGTSALTVNADSAHKTIEDLIKAIKDNPGKMIMGVVPGVGTHLFGVAFTEALGLKVKIVTYSGGGDLRVAILGKHVDFGPGSAIQDAELGDKVRLLALSDEKPMKSRPEAKPINQALKPYGASLPNIGDSRFIAVHKRFVQQYPERWKLLLDTYKRVYDSAEYQQSVEKLKNKEITQFITPEAAAKFMKEQHELIMKYKAQLAN
jgi:tripartite-type tricarboxylate transporter receptor subunit TctC